MRLLLQGKSGIRPIEGFDTSHLPTRFAGEILGFHSNGYLSKKMERRLDNCIKFAMTSGKKVRSSHVSIPQSKQPVAMSLSWRHDIEAGEQRTADLSSMFDYSLLEG